jgi:hypothetical protein
MPKKVKKGNQTKISSKHQVTIPADAFHIAALAEGDVLRVEAASAGRIVLSRMDETVDCYSGCLNTGGDLRRQISELRDEWQ